MGNKIKIHEIAKKIGVSSKEALERAKSLGIEVSSHLSGVEEQEAKRIEDSFQGTNNQTMLHFSSEIVLKIHSGLIPLNNTALLPDSKLPNQCILAPV